MKKVCCVIFVNISFTCKIWIFMMNDQEAVDIIFAPIGTRANSYSTMKVFATHQYFSSF